MSVVAALSSWLAIAAGAVAPVVAPPAPPAAVPAPPPARAVAADEVAASPARRKAALVVVSGLPAPPHVGGVILFAGNVDAPRPPRTLVTTDQEGGTVKRFPDLPPFSSAAAMTSVAQALAAGRETGEALRREGVHIDFAPVLDSPDGPLGSRHFSKPAIAVAFGRGLVQGGAGACAKHFPGLGSTPESTDRARVRGIVRAFELKGFRQAIDAGLPCVMVGHAIYARFGERPASLEPRTYALLRRLGFEGVAITDALDPLGRADEARNAVLAMRAGADLVLIPNPGAAAEAIEALVPLARAGALDEAVARVLAWRRSFGLTRLP
ncbi:MAG: glycoside hydrolase family 3 N-terminal domain-containing protein [Thermoleophilia bacterium]